MSVPAQRARGWINDVTAHNYAEHLRMLRALAREKLGVKNQEDLPYPASQSTSVEEHYHFHAAEEATPPAALPAPTTPAPPPAPPDQYQLVIRERQPDGTWKETVRPWKIGDQIPE